MTTAAATCRCCRQDPCDCVAPAHSAEGRSCVQCSDPAWHVQIVPFCQKHDQSTSEDARYLEHFGKPMTAEYRVHLDRGHVILPTKTSGR